MTKYYVVNSKYASAKGFEKHQALRTYMEQRNSHKAHTVFIARVDGEYYKIHGSGDISGESVLSKEITEIDDDVVWKGKEIMLE